MCTCLLKFWISFYPEWFFVNSNFLYVFIYFYWPNVDSLSILVIRLESDNRFSISISYYVCVYIIDYCNQKKIIILQLLPKYSSIIDIIKWYNYKTNYIRIISIMLFSAYVRKHVYMYLRTRARMCACDYHSISQYNFVVYSVVYLV